MESPIKRKRAESIRRALTRRVAATGFARTKTTFWTRPREHVIQFFHLHLFSFVPSFRVHLGVRTLNDAFPAPSLNGPVTPDGWFQGARKYVFDFEDSAESVDTCAAELAAYVHNVAVPWLDAFSDTKPLLSDPASPLDADAKRALELSIAHRADPHNVQRSKNLFGIA